MENQNEYWQNQVILVTGSSRGIGRQMAIHFSSLGAKVAINYNANEEKAQQVLNQCNPERTRMYRADVGSESDVKDMISAIQNDLGEISILVNNAGQTRDGLLMTMPTDDWHALTRTHLDGAFYCSREVLRNMMSNKFGRIINVSSVSGLVGTAGQCNYSTVKSGLIGFTRALSREMGKKNITCNAMALGVIETEMTQDLPETVLKDYKKSTSLRRFGSVDEVAGLAEYLAGPMGGYVTGQVITLDGGMT